MMGEPEDSRPPVCPVLGMSPLLSVSLDEAFPVFCSTSKVVGLSLPEEPIVAICQHFVLSNIVNRCGIYHPTPNPLAQVTALLFAFAVWLLLNRGNDSSGEQFWHAHAFL